MTRARIIQAKLWSFLIVASGLFSRAYAQPRAASSTPDCPASFRPYSVDRTVFLDLLLDPRATAVIEKGAPGVLSKLPEFLKKTTPPTIADILTLRMVFAGPDGKDAPDDRLQWIDQDLAALPITPEVAAIRCARYDETPPELPTKLKHPAILLFTKINGFKDDASVSAANAALREIGKQRHWTLFLTEDGAVFNTEQLARFDAVVWNNVSGDVLTVPQRAAFKRYIEQGGAYVGFHGSGGDPYYDWEWYADSLLGARFLSHPMDPEFQEARLKLDDPKDPILRGLPDEWRMTDEWYSFKSDPRNDGSHILVTLDESTYSPRNGSMDLHMGNHPIAWTRQIGKGRMFYTAIDHRPESYTEPHFRRLLMQGIDWAVRQEDHPRRGDSSSGDTMISCRTMCRFGCEEPDWLRRPLL